MKNSLRNTLNLAAQLAQNGEGRCLFIYAGLDRRLAIIVTRHQGKASTSSSTSASRSVSGSHLEGVDRVVLQLIIRQRIFAGTEEQQTILHIARPLQAPRQR